MLQSRERGHPRRVLLGLLLALTVSAVAGCNTVADAGRDIEALGRAVADTAERARR